MKNDKQLTQRISGFIYRFSNLIAFAFAGSLLVYFRPGADLLAELGFKDDLIRMTMLALAVIPALAGGIIIRTIFATPALIVNSSD